MKEKVFSELVEFLTKHETKPNKLKGVDYRKFYGNIRLSLEWIKRRELNQSQIVTAQEINILLKNWQNNYTSKLSVSKRGLEDLSREFSELLNKMLEKDTTNSTTIDLEGKLQEVESGLKWLNWWNKNKKWVIGLGVVAVVIILLVFINWVRKFFG